MLNNQVVYIAGPMTGIDNYNYDAFKDAERKIKEEYECVVLNPATMPHGLKHHQYMDICFAMLRQCTAIFLLPDWEKSAGANMEVAYAKSLGLLSINTLNSA